MLILRTEAEDPKWLLPAFEDGLVAFLKVLGVTSPIIIGLVLLAFSVKSWIDALFLGKRLVGRARVTADATRQHLYAIGPLRIALASSVTTAVIAAQLITLALMLLAGTLASALEELATLGPGWETSGSRAAQNYLAFQAAWTEDGIRDLVRSRGLGDVYKRQFSSSSLTLCSSASSCSASRPDIRSNRNGFSVVRGLVCHLLSIGRRSCCLLFHAACRQLSEL